MPYVMVAVPAELLPQIAELVAKYTGESVYSDGPGQPVPSEASVTPTPDGSQASGDDAVLINAWTAPLVRRAYVESGDAMRAILEYLAANVGTEVTSYDVADHVDEMKDWNSVAGALGAFGRRCANRYGMDKQPWAWRYDSQDRVLMKMPAAVADVIKQVAAE